MKTIILLFWNISRANVAAAAGGIIFFMLYLPYSFMVVWEESLDPNAKIASVSKIYIYIFISNVFHLVFNI